jgi:hypothetical protein
MKMRKIKFRAWHKTDEKMYEVYGFSKNQWFLKGKNFPMPPSAVVIQQYTGLTDTNEVEIFEGDIVKYLDGNEWSTESGYDCEEFDNLGIIFFDEECGRYDVTNKQGVGYDDLFDCGIDFEIVGNFYENPELVKEIENSFNS